MKKGYEFGIVTIIDLLSAEKQLSEHAKSKDRHATDTSRLAVPCIIRLDV